MFGRIPPVLKNLIIINTILFLASLIIPGLTGLLALFPFKSPLFHPYQFLTYMFMHGGWIHIFFNMYTLLFFGSVLEQVWGGKKFLLFYLVTGIGAALLHNGVMALKYSDLINLANQGDLSALEHVRSILLTPTVGASGAIYGVLMAFGMLFPDRIVQLLIPPVALKAKWFVIIFAVIELLIGLSNAADGVAHFAHLGGMLFGYLLILYWKHNGRMYY